MPSRATTSCGSRGPSPRRDGHQLEPWCRRVRQTEAGRCRQPGSSPPSGRRRGPVPAIAAALAAVVIRPWRLVHHATSRPSRPGPTGVSPAACAGCPPWPGADDVAPPRPPRSPRSRSPADGPARARPRPGGGAERASALADLELTETGRRELRHQRGQELDPSRQWQRGRPDARPGVRSRRSRDGDPTSSFRALARSPRGRAACRAAGMVRGLRRRAGSDRASRAAGPRVLAGRWRELRDLGLSVGPQRTVPAVPRFEECLDRQRLEGRRAARR